MRVVICGGKRGNAIIYCHVNEFPTPGDKVEMSDARMVLRIDKKCGGLFGFTQKGPIGKTWITCAVPKVIDTCRQALSVSDEAIRKIDSWPDY